MIQLIKPDGTEKLVSVSDNVSGEPTLEQLYKWIGCDLIEVPGDFVFDGGAIQFVLDEEGKLKRKPYNPKATQLYEKVLKANGCQTGWDVLVGNVIVLTGPHLLT